MDPAEMTPPPEAVSLTSDGLLHKLTLHEGTGDVPPKHSRCLVHYVGRLSSTGEVFMDTRQESNSGEPQQIVAGRDSSYQEVGLNLAVATMRCGEKARVWSAPKYGYGERGSFSFPTVPPNADLVYEIELLDFEAPSDGKERLGMTFEERLEAAERRRQDGNTLFRQEQFDEALSKYRLSLSYLNEDMLMQLGDFHFQKAMDVKRPVLLNIAACQLRQEDYHGTIATCSEVLGEDKHNAKALFRRGKARHALGQTDAALADLEAAQAAAPQDIAITKELALVQKAVKQEKAAAGRLFKGYFDKTNGMLYDEMQRDDQPPQPLTPETSYPSGTMQRHAQQLVAPLRRWNIWKLSALAAVASVVAYAYVGWSQEAAARRPPPPLPTL